MKQCSRCKETKSLNNFYVDKTRKPGYSSRCKKCGIWSRKEFKKKHPEYQKEYWRKYYKPTSHWKICKYCNKEFVSKKSNTTCCNSVECKRLQNHEIHQKTGKLTFWKNKDLSVLFSHSKKYFLSRKENILRYREQWYEKHQKDLEQAWMDFEERRRKRGREIYKSRFGLKLGVEERICINCEGKFIIHNGNQKYCSRECWCSVMNKRAKEDAREYRKSHPIAPKWKTCQNCDRLFIIRCKNGHQSYCSAECRKIKENERKKLQRKWIGNWSKEKYNQYQRKIRKNPATNLRYNMASAASNALKGKKTNRHWETLVGYSLKDLMAHLERQFEPWMNWNNYGSGCEKWLIDHFIPSSWFQYSNSEDLEFKYCWSLENLRPLSATMNSHKLNRGGIKILLTYLFLILNQIHSEGGD